MDFGFAAVGAITVLCYLAAQVVKITTLDNKWLPVICGAFGCILGAVCFYVMPDYPAGDIITALAVGAISGLAATGANQVYKQLTAKNDKGADEE